MQPSLAAYVKLSMVIYNLEESSDEYTSDRSLSMNAKIPDR